MIIHKMTASFGTLKNETLELLDGLNIVNAPNESGKSTWCSFIRAMFYGIDSSAREKGGIKPDKVKFAPWNGIPMAGTMDIEYKGAEITLSRQGRETSPMRDFSATYTGTSNAVKNIDHALVGETILGVSKDVFERSAFIGQGKMTLGGSPELEKRISAIVQTGEEKSSITEAEERIKTAMRRRRYNKSGRLPEIERELEEIQAKLAEGEREIQRGEELKKAKREALERRDALTDRVSELRKTTRRETLDKLAYSRNRVKTHENDYNEIKAQLNEVGKKLDEGAFGREDPKKCRQKLNVDKKQLAVLEKEEKQGGAFLLNIAVLAVFLIATAVVAGFSHYFIAAGTGVLAIIQAYRIFLQRRNLRQIENEKNEIFAEYRCLTVEGMELALATHESLCGRYNELVEIMKQVMESLDEANILQAELETALLKELDFSEGESESATFTRRLDEAETALRNIREESALWEGRQSVLEDSSELKSQIDELVVEHKRLTKEFDALSLALKTLAEAGDEISHRITPRLSFRTAEIFSQLTASGYDAILLDRELKAAARPHGDTVARDTSYLSTGTLDQLYLAVRLAICELALPVDNPCPIILDDALVNFDDERCRYALELLRKVAVNRQIILFTCHGREAVFLQDCPDVFIANGRLKRK